jgi:hypothetical protein
MLSTYLPSLEELNEKATPPIGGCDEGEAAKRGLPQIPRHGRIGIQNHR